VNTSLISPSGITSDAPLVTVILMAYNQEKFIKDAIFGAFTQTYTPLEIIISDDASTDSTWDIILEESDSYHGQHKVHIRQSEANRGINRHFNELMEKATGEYIVIMSGDDISLPNRVEISVKTLIENKSFGLFSNGIRVDQNGAEMGLFMIAYPENNSWEMILKCFGNGGAGFSMCWHRKVYEVFGQIPEQPLGEDAFIPFRSALMGKMLYLNTPLVKYREHGSNASFWSAKKQSKTLVERKLVANKMANHYLLMYEKWRLDILVAFDHEFLTKDEFKFANAIIEDMIWVYQQRVAYFDRSLIVFLWKLMRMRKAYISKNFYGMWRNELHAFLPVFYPRLYQVLKNINSPVRKFF
jgi:glycosyltransferase involved in cell wall biosynthesis